MPFFFKRYRADDDDDKNMEELLKDLTNEATVANMVKNSIRSFLRDTQHPDSDEFIKILEVGNVSEDVADMEWDESARRLEKMEYLFPALESFAGMYAKAWATSTTRQATEDGASLPPDFIDKTSASLQLNLLACLVGSVSQLIEFELIEIPRRLP